MQTRVCWALRFRPETRCDLHGRHLIPPRGPLCLAMGRSVEASGSLCWSVRCSSEGRGFQEATPYPVRPRTQSSAWVFLQ